MSLNRRDFLTVLGAGAVAGPGIAESQDLPTSSRELWDYVRQQAVVDPGLAWLNTAEGGPSLRRVLIEEYRHREALSRNRDNYLRSYLAGAGLQAFLTGIAGLLGAQPQEIAFTSGATASMGLLANGIDFVAEDEIVTTVHEHPGGVYPWLLAAKRRGVKVIQLPLPTPLSHPQHVIDAFAGALSPKTRLMIFSHVQYTDGSVLPVRELCELARTHEVLSVVDGAQALGMLPVAVHDLGCDFYVGNLHKWVNGTPGAGVLYLRDAARHRVWPGAVAGHDEWDTLDRFGLPDAQPAAAFRADWPASMRKYNYDFQHLAPLHMSALPAIDFARQIGSARWTARIRELAWYLRLQLQPITGLRLLTSSHPALWAGIVSFQLPGLDSGELVETLRSKHRVAVAAVRNGESFDAVRVSTHVYNSYDEIDRLVAALRRLAT
jgi:isopenicillin-N epimerase